jgi:hypothetical protein
MVRRCAHTGRCEAALTFIATIAFSGWKGGQYYLQLRRGHAHVRRLIHALQTLQHGFHFLQSMVLALAVDLLVPELQWAAVCRQLRRRQVLCRQHDRRPRAAILNDTRQEVQLQAQLGQLGGLPSFASYHVLQGVFVGFQDFVGGQYLEFLTYNSHGTVSTCS